MKKVPIIFYALKLLQLLGITQVQAQSIGINTTIPDASAILDITHTTKGILIPRMTTLQRLAIVLPATGLQVYDIDLKGIYVFDGTWDCLNTPAGTVQYFANTIAPRGYLECNGQSVSTTTYPELFAAIGYLYGGSGVTFQLPDLRGEFVRGWDNNRGVDAGRTVGAWQKGTAIGWDSDNNALVNISVVNPAAVNNCTDVGADNATLSDFPGVVQTAAPATVNSQPFPSVSASWGTGGMTRPRNISLMPCIKF